MSKKKQENDKLKQKITDFLKEQKTLSETKDIIQGVGLKNSAYSRNLIRRTAKESAEIKTEKIHKRYFYWFAGAPKPPMLKPDKKGETKKPPEKLTETAKAKPAQPPTKTKVTKIAKPKKELKPSDPDPTNPWRKL